MKKEKKNTFNGRYNKTGWGFVIFAVLSISLFVFYPMIQSFITSFKTGMGNNLQFNGLDNYKRLLSDQNFKIALKNTLTYLIVQVPIMLFLALMISVMLNNSKLKLRGLFRVAIFLPSVTSLVAYSTIFKSLFTNDGLMNKVLMTMGLIGENINWLTDPFWAKITIIIAITWRWTGYNMIFYLAALQNIDTEVYEAAELDGANAIRKFFNITVPLLKPIILFTTITSTIGTLQLFDEVVNITGGGPANATMTLSQYIYNLSFMYTPNFGYAATVSYTILVLVVGLSLIQLIYGGDKREKN